MTDIVASSPVRHQPFSFARCRHIILCPAARFKQGGCLGHVFGKGEGKKRKGRREGIDDEADN